MTNDLKNMKCQTCTGETEPLKDEDAFGNPSISAVNTCLVLEKPEAGHWDYTIEYAAK